MQNDVRTPTPQDLWPGKCIKYSRDWQTYTVKDHDWRLIDESREYGPVPKGEGRKPGDFDFSGGLHRYSGRTIRRWYCTRCRTIAETVT